MNKGFVYRWTNNITKMWYIGSHGGDINDGYIANGCYYEKALIVRIGGFAKAVKKYGLKNFTRDIIMECDEYDELEDFILKEKNASKDIMSYNNRNCSAGGDTWSGKTHTQETKNKMAISHIGKKRKYDYITPAGVFNTSREAAKPNNLTNVMVYRKCKHEVKWPSWKLKKLN